MTEEEEKKQNQQRERRNGYGRDWYGRNRAKKIEAVTEYKRKNPDKVSATNARYWEKHKDEINARRRKNAPQNDEQSVTSVNGV